MNHDEDKVTKAQNEEISQGEAKHQAKSEETKETQSAERQAEQEPPKNDEHQNENTDDVEIEKTWHNKNALKRGIAMLGYGFVAGFVRFGITLIAIFQFLSLLFAEKPNQPLVNFGQNLNTYLYQINQFLTVNSEMYPFPFADWPDSEPKAKS